MKKLFLTITVGLLTHSTILAQQISSAFNYQAIVRDASDDIISNQSIGLLFEIHDLTEDGALVYAEIQFLQTNEHGLFTAEVGNGIPTAPFDPVDWSIGAKFLEVSIDTAGGTAFESMGTQELLSVPYALHAASSGDVQDGTEAGQLMHWDGTAWLADSGLYISQRRLGVGTATPNAVLSIESRDVLKTYFETGDIPAEDNFGITTDSAGFGIGQGLPSALVNRLFISDSTGNIGIGTTEPLVRLQVEDDQPNGVTGVKLVNTATMANCGWSIGHVQDPSDDRNGALMLFEDQWPCGGDLDFNDAIVRINIEGVGVGREDPLTSLHVSASPFSIGAQPLLDSAGGLLTIGSFTDNLSLDHEGIQSRVASGGGSSDDFDVSTLNFQMMGGDIVIHGDGALAESEKIRITENGDIGIGTLTPTESLDVNGGVRVGFSSGSNSGTIRWTGTGFEGRTDTGWLPFGSSWSSGGGSGIYYDPIAPRVGIGTATPLAHIHVHNSDVSAGNTKGGIINNNSTTTSTGQNDNRVGLELENSGAWGGHPDSKDIGLHVKPVLGQPDAHRNICATLDGNVVIGSASQQPIGNGGNRILTLQQGTAPQGPSDSGSGLPDGGVQLYSELDASGISILKVMDGNGQVIKMYKEAALTPNIPDPFPANYDPTVIDILDNMRTRIDELESRLQAHGLLE